MIETQISAGRTAPALLVPRMSEEQLQCAVMRHLEVRGRPALLAWHTPNGGFRRRTEAARFTALGVKSGIPDVLILFDGRTYGLELKIAKGRLTDSQIAMHARLRAAGAEVATAYGLDEALQQLERWGLLR
jgi:hypothetical protein